MSAPVRMSHRFTALESRTMTFNFKICFLQMTLPTSATLVAPFGQMT
jgi:hypothetical protein